MHISSIVDIKVQKLWFQQNDFKYVLVLYAFKTTNNSVQLLK